MATGKNMNSSTIIHRNCTGKMLDDKDIKMLVESLNRQNERQVSPNNHFIDIRMTEGENSGENLKIIQDNFRSRSQLKQEQKYYIPLNINNIHWAVLEIIQNGQGVTCKKINTDGMAYPIDQDIMNHLISIFKEKGYKPCEISNIKKQKLYTFSGQKENNCGIISSYIISDGVCNRLNPQKPLDQYGNSIEKEHDAETIRTLSSIAVVENHSEDYLSFCKPEERIIRRSSKSGGSFRDKERKTNQHILLEKLKKLDKASLESLYEIVSNDEVSVKEKLEQIRKKENVDFLFKNKEKEIKEDWDNLIKLAYENKYKAQTPAKIREHQLPQIKKRNKAKAKQKNHETCTLREPRKCEHKQKNHTNISGKAITMLTSILSLGLCICMPSLLTIIIFASVSCLCGLYFALSKKGDCMGTTDNNSSHVPAHSLARKVKKPVDGIKPTTTPILDKNSKRKVKKPVDDIKPTTPILDKNKLICRLELMSTGEIRIKQL